MDNAFHHVPVLFDEVMEWMAPRPDGVYLDGTLGGGGHSEGILRLSGGTARLYGIDRDGEAIAAASARLKAYPGFQAIHGNFHDAKALLCAAGAPPLTGALVDLGVSSHQLDEAARGFSYHEDAPLDMRMDPSQGPTAAEYLAGISQEEFRRILTEYGEEKWAARIAQIFVERREKAPILTTGDLVAVAPKAKDLLVIKSALISNERVQVPAWLEVDIEKLQGNVLALPQRDQIDLDIREQLIVELYSK